jgi:hypothetical protein
MAGYRGSMGSNVKDRELLRSLAERYAAIAGLDVQKQRIDRYYKTIGLEVVRPVVLIDEVPWGEIRDDALAVRCERPELQSLEQRLRRALYQWEHWQADFVIPPVFRVGKRMDSTGIGLEIQDTQVQFGSGTYAASHRYTDQLRTDADLEKLELPVLRYDRDGTEREAELARDVFAGLLPVEVAGTVPSYNIWDRIATFRGVDALLMDLAVRPDFMHRTARRFADIARAMFRQLLEQDLLDTSPLILHCTPACARELPAADYAGTVRAKDVWGRCSAQIFAAVSPAMHDEFDLVYNQEIFGQCGLLYYGCCEPLDRKVDLLRKRFPNLRKISITPWADHERAAEAIGGDYVLAAKPNPAFVASDPFRPEPVEQEIARTLEACRRHGTTCEFVLKDISTIGGNPATLTRWADTVASVIDRYY